MNLNFGYFNNSLSGRKILNLEDNGEDISYKVEKTLNLGKY